MAAPQNDEEVDEGVEGETDFNEGDVIGGEAVAGEFGLVALFGGADEGVVAVGDEGLEDGAGVAGGDADGDDNEGGEVAEASEPIGVD